MEAGNGWTSGKPVSLKLGSSQLEPVPGLNPKVQTVTILAKSNIASKKETAASSHFRGECDEVLCCDLKRCSRVKAAGALASSSYDWDNAMSSWSSRLSR